MEITVENPEKICRACLSTENNLKEISENDEDYESFLRIYKTCTSVDLNEIANLPLHVCETCVLRVKEFHTFREMCLQSHSTIQTILNKSEKIVVNGADEIFVFNNNSANTIKLQCDDVRNDIISDKKLAITKKRPPVRKYKCEICFEIFNDLITLGKHHESIHSTNDYSCAMCRETFINPSLLTRHVKTHKKEINETDTKIFQCSRCDKSYKTVVNLQIHVYSHIGLRPYKCEYCPKDFTKHSALMTHTNIHRGILNYLCSECGKGFNTALHLKRHKISHSSTRPYKCKFCPSSFAVPRDLTIHIRTHTGEKPFLCSTCGKAFRRANHLTVHRRIHTGEKPYQCSYCDKRFTQSGDWRAHERIHTGYKPYLCTICEKRFNQTSALTTHMKKHARPLFKCESCNKKFLKASSLEKHSLEHAEPHEITHEVFFV